MKQFLFSLKMLSFCLLFVLPCWLGTLTAQVATYKFSQFTIGFLPITGGTLLGTATNNDQFFVDPSNLAGGSAMTGPGFPIGFNFTYAGHVFDRVSINTNGWISFGQSSLSLAVNMTSTTTEAYAPLSASAISPLQLRCRVAAFGFNLQGQAGSSLQIQSSGPAPNRVCVIQWTKYKRFGAAGTGDMLNFQIRLYEGCNAVVMVYGANTFGATPTVNTHVGLGGSGAADYNNRTTANNWNSTNNGISNALGCSVGSSVTAPLDGRTFSWSLCATCVASSSGASYPHQDINFFTPAERTQLKDLIVQFILDANPNPLLGNGLGNGTNGFTGTQYHALFAQHGNCDFLSWHRDFLKKLEDYLLKQPGGECYVPLPKWHPGLPIPNEFFWNGTTGTSNSVTNGTLLQDNPPLGNFFSLEFSPCESTISICDFNTLMEAEYGYINANIGGVMGSSLTAAGAAIFYLFHAYIDDLYWNFESSCTPWVHRDCDLFTRDNPDDYGLEPNANVQVWNSPDMWVRNTQDALVNSTIPGYYTMGCMDDLWRHVNPEHSLTQPVYVYVKVRNRGTVQLVSGAKLRLYFTKASFGEAWPDTWGPPSLPTDGGEITTGGGITLPFLVPGQIYTLEIPWYPPDPGIGPTMYCLLSRIESLDDPMANEVNTPGTPIFGNVLNNNNIATKNLYVVNNLPGIVGNSGTFNMSASTAGLARIRFAPVRHRDLGASYTDIGRVTVALGGFYTNWEQAMFAASPFIEDVGGGNIRLLSGGGIDDYWINAMLEPNDTNSIRLSFELNPDFSEVYGYRDWNFEFSHEGYDISATGQPPGVFLGAQHYNIMVNYPCEANAGSDTLIFSGACTEIGTPSTCSSCNFSWSENGVVIPGATGPTLQVCPTFESTYALMVSDTASGCRFTDTVIVYVDRICSAVLGPSQYIIEHGQCVQIGGSGSSCPDCQFIWSPATGLSNPFIPNPIACPQEDIVYTLIVVRDSFCFAESPVTVLVYHCDGMVDAGPDQTIMLGTGVVIGTPDTMGTILYSWYPQAGLGDPYAAQPNAQPAETTTYVVYAHDTEHGCFYGATDTVTVTVCSNYYADTDGDGYGNATLSVFACSPPTNYVANNADCNDMNAAINPVATEICNNGIDDNCNGLIDLDCDPSSSIATIALPAHIRIFPNPNPGTFTVEMPEPAKPGTKFRITDLAGRLVQEQKTEPGSTQQTVRAGALPSGMYFLQVVSEGRVLAVEKFVKQ
ncbi:MAG: T9SS type A sorting domain-containing protein [Saprospiraceae bacterium]